jgi:glyoxylase-like metal-dependent hydrolase (beta-lactamase superfamily II)
MQLKFIGVGGLFAPISIGNSNMMLTSDSGKIMMIDFGLTAPYIIRDELHVELHNIDAVYGTHCHSDHTGGLEFLAFYRYFVPPISKPKLFLVDTQYAPSSLATAYDKADIIFHDCDSFEYPDGHSIHAVHAHYNDLKGLPIKIRNKMWMYHYSKNIETVISDGFAGFVEKGQEFII